MSTEVSGGPRPAREKTRASMTFALKGAGGEPVSLERTFNSHGVADLPPMRLDGSVLEVTVALPGGRPRLVRVSPERAGRGVISVAGRPPGPRTAAEIVRSVSRILRLDEDLSPFYARVAEDPDLSWAAIGAGRMIRSATVFEEVVKTICTTNCAWSATKRMVHSLVEQLGTPAAGLRPRGAYGRAFPSPGAMADASADFYRDTVRAGYRGAYLKALAVSVAEGGLDLEDLGAASREEIPDDVMAERLLALPGVGPYAAAHVMMMLGRYSSLILDSWTRPTYARFAGYKHPKRLKDATIVRRFRRYGEYAGLAFWLFITRDWVDEEQPV